MSKMNDPADWSDFFVPENISEDTLRSYLKTWMTECRSHTIELFHGIDPTTFCQQGHPEFSPIGWHLGHIAYTEALWLLGKCAGLDHHTKQGMTLAIAEAARLFAVDSLPKCQRIYLPSLSEVLAYCRSVRTQVFHYLDRAPLATEKRLWIFLLQHESQHSEIISYVLHMLGKPPNFPQPITTPIGEMRTIAAGSFVQGSTHLFSLDNEISPHIITLPTYQIDTHPVTRGQYRSFMEAGGYENRQWWTEQGWAWRQQNGTKSSPRYWHIPLTDHHPVYGISWFEASAFAAYSGKRLPSEAEWEKASPYFFHRGEVWEWTSSLFAPYPQFFAYPYPGYSSAYFDGKHYVMKGNCWKSRPWTRRSSFRNWYLPHIRDIFVGFRCAV